MKYEDLSMQRYILEKGVAKLLNFGMQVFELFADEVNMSFCDRNRVISKCRVAYGRTDLKEMECPPELKKERWKYYTQELKYPREKAIELLKLVDSSIENQFLPTIPNEIERILSK